MHDRSPFLGESDDPVIADFLHGLRSAFAEAGHRVIDAPEADTRVLVTTGRFGEPTNWRRALLFTGRMRYKLDQTPVVFTVVSAHASPTLRPARTQG